MVQKNVKAQFKSPSDQAKSNDYANSGVRDYSIVELQINKMGEEISSLFFDFFI